MYLKLVCDYLRLKTIAMKTKTTKLNPITLYTTFTHENKRWQWAVSRIGLALLYNSNSREKLLFFFAATQKNVLEEKYRKHTLTHKYTVKDIWERSAYENKSTLYLTDGQLYNPLFQKIQNIPQLWHLCDLHQSRLGYLVPWHLE